jgi:hypothetical protein
MAVSGMPQTFEPARISRRFRSRTADRLRAASLTAKLVASGHTDPWRRLHTMWTGAFNVAGLGAAKGVSFSGLPVRTPDSKPRPDGLRPASGRPRAAGVLGSMCTNVHACVPPFIGHLLDTKTRKHTKLLILLALPRGLEPLFSP